MLEISLAGPIIATFGAFFFAAHLLAVRKATVDSSSINVALSVGLITTFIFLPLSLFYLPDLNFSPIALLFFACSGIFANFLGYLCAYEGTKRIGASKTIPFTRGETLVAMLLGVIVLGEIITIGHLSGAFLLVGGVVVLTYEVKGNGSSSGWNISFDITFPLAAMVLFGTAALFDNIGLSYGVPIPVGLTVKFIAAVAGLALYSKLSDNNFLGELGNVDKKIFVLAGLTNAAALGFLYLGFTVSRIVVVMPFWSTSPLFGVILSYFFLKDLEKVSKFVIIGSLLVVIGAVMITVSM